MNKVEKATLVGLVLGDGHIDCSKNKGIYTNSAITFIHCKKQKEYLEWKADLLYKIFGGNKPKVIEFTNNGYNGVKMMKSNKYFRILHKYLYKNGRKTIPLKTLNRLTPLALAIWWMDDGCLFAKKRNNKIHAWELYLNTYLSDEENQIIINYFQQRWNILWKINHDKGRSRLRCSTKEGRKFLNIIRPIVNKIQCMQYKVINI